MYQDGRDQLRPANTFSCPNVEAGLSFDRPWCRPQNSRTEAYGHPRRTSRIYHPTRHELDGPYLKGLGEKGDDTQVPSNRANPTVPLPHTGLTWPKLDDIGRTKNLHGLWIIKD